MLLLVSSPFSSATTSAYHTFKVSLNQPPNHESFFTYFISLITTGSACHSTTTSYFLSCHFKQPYSRSQKSSALWYYQEALSIFCLHIFFEGGSFGTANSVPPTPFPSMLWSSWSLTPSAVTDGLGKGLQVLFPSNSPGVIQHCFEKESFQAKTQRIGKPRKQEA